jgi:hypothetical protein
MLVFWFNTTQEIFHLAVIGEIRIRAVFLDPTDAF